MLSKHLRNATQPFKTTQRRSRLSFWQLDENGRLQPSLADVATKVPDEGEMGRGDVWGESSGCKRKRGGAMSRLRVWCGRGTWTEGALPINRGRERLA